MRPSANGFGGWGLSALTWRMKTSASTQSVVLMDGACAVTSFVEGQSRARTANDAPLARASPRAASRPRTVSGALAPTLCSWPASLAAAAVACGTSPGRAATTTSFPRPTTTDRPATFAQRAQQLDPPLVRVLIRRVAARAGLASSRLVKRAGIAAEAGAEDVAKGAVSTWASCEGNGRSWADSRSGIA